jgi:hypothetical protein
MKHVIYHLVSAQEMSVEILSEIKTTFLSKPIRIIVEEDNDLELTAELKQVLDDRLAEDPEEYLTSEESIKKLQVKYGL